MSSWQGPPRQSPSSSGVFGEGAAAPLSNGQHTAYHPSTTPQYAYGNAYGGAQVYSGEYRPAPAPASASAAPSQYQNSIPAGTTPTAPSWSQQSSYAGAAAAASSARGPLPASSIDRVADATGTPSLSAASPFLSTPQQAPRHATQPAASPSQSIDVPNPYAANVAGTSQFASHTRPQAQTAPHPEMTAARVGSPDTNVCVPAHIQLPDEMVREAFADEVVQASARQWAERQYRRHLETTGGAEADYLQHDALTGASREIAGDELADVVSGVAAGTLDPQALQRHLADLRRREQQAAEGVSFVVRARPKHQGRLLLLLAVTLFGTLPLMSNMCFVALLTGIVMTYVMDFLDYPRATIFAMLATVVCFGVAVLLSNFHAAISQLGPMLLILDLICVLLTVAAAGLLHFSWVQETYPELICATERAVMAVAPLLAMPSLLSTSLALAGSRYGPVAFFCAMCVLHRSFYSPLESSFLRVAVPAPAASQMQAAEAAKTKAKVAGGGIHGNEPSQRRARLDEDENPEMASSEGTRPQQLNGRVEALFFTLMLLTLPALVYTALQSNWADHIIANIFNPCAFISGAIVYLCVDPSRSTWFLVPPPRQTPSTTATMGGGSEQVKAALAAEEVLRRLEYDPLGLQASIDRNRLAALSSSCAVSVLWAGYRLVTSRHAYIFNGLPFPGNLIALTLILYLVLYVVLETMQLLDLDAKGVDVRKPKYLTRRALVVLAAQFAAVTLCLVTGAPPTFFLPASLSIAAFHLFLLDRTNAGPMIAFTVFSSLMLLWCLYRTFSFLVVDLHVLGEVASVPTPVLSVSVLWMYVLGCITFTLSFSPNKATLILFLFMYVSQLTWIEHVLYSQKEEGTYPGILVFATTAVGVFVARRLYQNEVLGVSAAAFVASCFLAKIPTFFIEVTSSYYYDEITLARARKVEELQQQQRQQASAEAFNMARDHRLSSSRPSGQTMPTLTNVRLTLPPESDGMYHTAGASAWDRSAKLYAIESSLGWWVALVGGYVAALFVLESRRRLDVKHAARYIVLYGFCAAVLSLCTMRNVQRAVYEFITRSYVDADEVRHVGVGTMCAMFALLTMPLFSHLQKKYASAHNALRVTRLVGAASVLLLLVQPTRVAETHVSSLDYEFEYADYGRWAAAAGFSMVIAGRFLAQAGTPLLLRAVYWLLTSLAVGYGTVTVLLPVPTIQLFLFVWTFVFLTMLCVDLAHYRRVRPVELYVVYGLSVVAILMAFFSLNRVDLQRVSGGSTAVMWEIHEQGRLQLLAVVMATNFFLSVLLRFRVTGRPLLPHSTPFSGEDSYRGVSVIANYATMLTTCVTSVLNFYANDSEPLLYVLAAGFLLLLVDDGEIFLALHKAQFRYFPPVAFVLAMLWFCSVYNAWRTAVILPLKVQNVGLTLFCGLVTFPAQASLLRFLYQDRSGDGGDSVLFVILSGLVSGVLIFFAPQQSLRWMAVTACCGQAWRLFSRRLSERSGRRGHDARLTGPKRGPTRPARRI